MSIRIKDLEYDTMGEACARLGISRSSLLRYLAEGFLTEPPFVKQGRGKKVRYFTETWYEINLALLRRAQDGS